MEIGALKDDRELALVENLPLIDAEEIEDIGFSIINFLVPCVLDNFSIVLWVIPMHCDSKRGWVTLTGKYNAGLLFWH